MIISTGMIGISGGGHFIQKAIKWFSRSRYSHSFIIIDGPFGTLSVMETSATVVTVRDLKCKESEPDYIDYWFISQATDIEIANALRATYTKYSGQWYGYLSYLWFIYRAFARVLGKEPRQVWAWARRGTTCTELTAYYLSQLNSTYGLLFKDIDLSSLWPQDLLNIMMDNSELFSKVPGDTCIYSCDVTY